MISSGFHSPALLVHLSELWVAIRKFVAISVSSVFRPISNEILLSWSQSPFVLSSFPNSLESSLISSS